MGSSIEDRTQVWATADEKTHMLNYVILCYIIIINYDDLVLNYDDILWRKRPCRQPPTVASVKVYRANVAKRGLPWGRLGPSAAIAGDGGNS